MNDDDDSNVIDLHNARMNRDSGFAFEIFPPDGRSVDDLVGEIESGPIVLLNPEDAYGIALSPDDAERLGVLLIMAANTCRLRIEGRLREP